MLRHKRLHGQTRARRSRRQEKRCTKRNTSAQTQPSPPYPPPPPRLLRLLPLLPPILRYHPVPIAGAIHSHPSLPSRPLATLRPPASTTAPSTHPATAPSATPPPPSPHSTPSTRATRPDAPPPAHHRAHTVTLSHPRPPQSPPPACFSTCPASSRAQTRPASTQPHLRDAHVLRRPAGGARNRAAAAAAGPGGGGVGGGTRRDAAGRDVARRGASVLEGETSPTRPPAARLPTADTHPPPARDAPRRAALPSCR